MKPCRKAYRERDLRQGPCELSILGALRERDRRTSELLCFLNGAPGEKTLSNSMSVSHDPLPIRSHAVDTWRLPSLAKTPIVTSSRLRSSLGLFSPRSGEVRLAAFLADASTTLYREVVLHELAHAAVHLKYGPGRRPHGNEWRGFMVAVGLQPRVRLPREELGGLSLRPVVRRARIRWRHRCPVCQTARVAGRPVRRWRCSSCVSAGLSGELTITRLAPRRSGRCS